MKSLITPNSKKLMDAIKNHGGEARFVGGCVRDSILGVVANDIDLATNLRPEDASNALTTSGYQVIPTGIKHGTITTIIDNEKFEVTTLRLDKETDGRHAVVEFTDDWQADAARRDFTFNALYMGNDGTIYDWFGGEQDLRNGVVKFIGDPHERIKEDALRILRYFRFQARFGKNNLDMPSLMACADLSMLITNLSAERKWSELKKLFEYDTCSEIWRLMLRLEIPGKCFSDYLPIREGNLLDRMIKLEKKYDKPDAIRRFVSVLCFPPFCAEQAALALKFSNDEKEYAVDIAHIPADNIHETLYCVGKETTKSILLMQAARHGFDVKNPDEFHHCLNIINSWDDRKFPLSGKDLIELGFTPGKEMGKMLKATENWWLEELNNGKNPNKDQCVNILKAANKWKKLV